MAHPLGKLGISSTFWRGRRVLVTGHTGFKGSWLCLWLENMGACVTGYAIAPPTCPNLFELADVGRSMTSVSGDIRDGARLRSVVERIQPEVIVHLAAQPLVRRSYSDPTETYSTNVMGTVNVLETVRCTESIRVAIVVTSDKCYRNQGWAWGYRENDALGGHDPYSSSKGCAELVTAAYRQSYFDSSISSRGVGVASARAGNVIGGGDWATDRLIPDMMRAFCESQPVFIRNPLSMRPWQHVLEPLRGYLLLAQRLWDTPQLGESWNFGPRDDDARPVIWVVERLAELWGNDVRWQLDQTANHPHEDQMLKLDCSRAASQLGWTPQLSLNAALEWTAEWYRGHVAGADVRELTLRQIRRYESLNEEGKLGSRPENCAVATAL